MSNWSAPHQVEATVMRIQKPYMNFLVAVMPRLFWPTVSGVFTTHLFGGLYVGIIPKVG